MPSEKRTRQRADKAARMAELRKAQQRRRNQKRGAVVGGVIVLAVVIALLTTVLGGGNKHKKAKSASASTSTSSSTTGATTTTTLPALTQPLSVAKLETYLKAHAAPAKASTAVCDAKGTASASTTTTPAKGHAVSIVQAPKGIGFPNLDGSSARYTKFSSAPPFCINVKDNYLATVKTTAGTMQVLLLPKYAPVTVNSFVFLAGYHYFDGIVFHRVIQDFMNQTGDPTGTGDGGPGYEFQDELPASADAYDAGSVAMANAGANTNGSQIFFVDTNASSFLKASYSVFGQVVSGINVVRTINAAGASLSSGNTGTPSKYYKIISVSVKPVSPTAYGA